jgi:hypothetical protein
MSIIAAPRHDHSNLSAAFTGSGDRTGSDRRFEVELRASGAFVLTCSLMESVGDALDGWSAMDRPILSANLARGTVDLRAGVRASSRSAAHDVAARVLVRAMTAAGVDDVQVKRSGFRGGVLATAYSPSAALATA